MPVIAMELRDIEYFTVVAQHGHLGRAAEALGLTQPALSKSLRRLEHELGAKLVKRTPKGVELSAEGIALLARAGELRLSVQAMAQEIRDVSRGRIGHVRIGAGPVSSAEMLVEALLPLVRDAPKISFNIVVSDNDLMIPALRRGELDLMVGYAPRALPREGLVEEHLFEA
jgi:DNA-binding transcriptional LysR family regulator